MTFHCSFLSEGVSAWETMTTPFHCLLASIGGTADLEGYDHPLLAFIGAK